MADLQYGTSGFGLAFGVPVGANFVVNSNNTNYTFTLVNRYDHTVGEGDEKETIDPTTGEVVNLTAWKFRERVTVEAKPAAANKAASLAVFLAPIKRLDVVTFNASCVDTLLKSAVWYVETVTRAAAEDDHLKVTFNLRRYTNNLTLLS